MTADVPKSRPTVNDIARAAGVSVATVSRALRGLPNVSDVTRERVREVAESYQYEAHPQAARLASGRAWTIGLVAPLFGTWFPTRALQGINSVLSTAGYDLLISLMNHPEDRQRFMDTSMSFCRRVDGIILIDTFFDEARRDGRLEFDCPVVAVGERMHSASSIFIDNRSAARRATEHLIGLGHTRIGLIAGAEVRDFPSPVPSQRRLGYEQALRCAGLPVQERYVACGGDWSPDGGTSGLRRLLGLADPPTAVFCMSDEMAYGAMHAAQQAGIAVPDELSIVGFDDHEFSATLGLTTMRQAVHEMGINAAEAIVGLIEGSAPVSDVTWEVSLVVRSTSGPPA